jgi:hypothetical protein
MNWRRYLIDVPAVLFSLWWKLYGLLMLVMFMVLASVAIIAVVLQLGFGVRWGW